ncbi:MAG: T9SS type A sorting domain-containing protein [Bacteroidota bacterium]
MKSMNTKSSITIGVLCSAAFIVFLVIFLPKDKPLKFSGAMQALQLWNEQRAYPDAEIDDEKYFTAFRRQRDAGLAEKQISFASDQWRQIGPHNIGGRTLAVAVNPQNTTTIYAGSASGGLWRSFTEGKGALAWNPVKTGFPVLGVSSIAIVPGDSNIMLIGTGEVYNRTSSIGGISIRTTRGSYGIGILRSTNGGASWSKVLDWSYGQLRGVQSIKIHPNYFNHVWAATSEGLFKSVDTGKTWVSVSSVLMGTDIVFDPNDTNVVIAAHGNLGSTGRGIYRTLNGGTTWEHLTQGLPADFGGKIIFSQYAAAPNVIYASIGNGASSGTWLCKTTNYGASWEILSTTDYASYQGWYSHFVGVDPVDSTKIICGGVDLFKSTNGGRTLSVKTDWSAWYFGTPQPGEPEGPANYSHADHHVIVYDPIEPNTVYFGTDGGVFCSTDGGETFEGRNGGYQTTQFYNGFSSAWLDSNLAIGGMQDNATAIYEGTVAWRRVIGGDGCMTAMSPTSTDTMYGSSQVLSLLRSANKGISFSGMSIPSSSVTNFVGPFALSESEPKVLYAGRDKVYKTINSGVNWITMNSNVPLDGNPVLAIAIAPTSSDTVYVTTTPRSSRGKVFRTTNGGSTWTNITGSLPDRYMIDIVVHPVSSSTVYVTLSGFGTSHLYTSTDAGTTWINIGNGLPDVPTSAVAVDPFNTTNIYVGNDLGVYVSTNSGSTWNTFSDGLYDATLIMDLSISQQNRSIRGVTHGNGVFERKLLQTPTAVNSGQVVATEFRLYQNYPNPFNPTTTISYIVPKQTHVSIIIYDQLGRKMESLVDQNTPAGSYSVTLNAANYASGTYYYTMKAGIYSATKSMVLIK